MLAAGPNLHLRWPVQAATSFYLYFVLYYLPVYAIV